VGYGYHAKGRGIVHWIVYGIAPGTTGLAEAEAAPPGGVSGTNRTCGPGYFGRCPPAAREMPEPA
jgi:hypothetical protein